MEEKIEYYEQLITRYLTGVISSEESEELIEWLEKDEQNKNLFFQYTSIWNESGSIALKPDRDKEWNKLLHRLDKIGRLHQKGVWVRVLKTAAVFMFAFIIGWLVSRQHTDDSQRSWLEVNVPTGQMTKISLSDGSDVWINSESTFRYTSEFSKETREVYLSGEAYFEIAKDKELPFIVKTDYRDIKVLGTRFNVSAYKEDSFFRTQLLEGKVSLQNHQQDPDPFILVRGDVATYNKSCDTYQVKRNMLLNQQSIDWIEGRYEFYDEPLSDILNRASRWYGIQFEVLSEQLRKTHFTGVMKRDYPVDQLLNLIEKTSDVEIEKKAQTIIIKP